MPTIRIDDDVYKALQELAVPFQDTPNSVLRRVLQLTDQAESEGTEGGVQELVAETGASKGRGRRRRTVKTTRKRQRAPKGSILQEEAYELPILQVLDEKGGRAPVTEVLESLQGKLNGKLKPLDRETLDSGGIRWHNRAQFVRLRLVKSGDLKDDSPRGLWEISEQGRARLDQVR